MFEALAALGLLSLVFSLCAGLLAMAFELLLFVAITLFWVGAFIVVLVIEVCQRIYAQYVWLRKKMKEEEESVRISP